MAALAFIYSNLSEQRHCLVVPVEDESVILGDYIVIASADGLQVQITLTMYNSNSKTPL